ncbi:hypothetical protein E2562_000779 [Oryza meyeriana var. granulata]|uniref:Uncharacterized protein n=1 Tax=Oryza meyeriana var. granulata TaxID=110450 RepID=A0A6G1DUP6_9ORYZ|nr:hypothetical protein E2562_000779 [Oryza meyeriana var. granulata]
MPFLPHADCPLAPTAQPSRHPLGHSAHNSELWLRLHTGSPCAPCLYPRTCGSWSSIVTGIFWCRSK